MLVSFPTSFQLTYAISNSVSIIILLGNGPKALGEGSRKLNYASLVCSDDKKIIENLLVEVDTPNGVRLVVAKPQLYQSPMHHDAQRLHTSG